MWKDSKKANFRAFLTPPPPESKNSWKSTPCTPIQTFEANTRLQHPATVAKVESFHVLHKVPNGDSPYVKAKHAQLIDRDPSKAIALFWSAINAGDRVDSALKDMAIVMKQLSRTDEAIEAVKSFRHLCTPQSQESLDNVLIDLYKRGGRIEEHIELLQHKLKLIEEGVAFGGKRTKIARSMGKKHHVSIEQEKSRLLGNLAWAYMQQNNYHVAEELYRKALSIEPDKNKQCNLSICLMNMGHIMEARSLLQAVTPSTTEREMDDPFIKSYDRAYEMLNEFESKSVPSPRRCKEIKSDISRSSTSPVSLDSKLMASLIEKSMLLENSCNDSVQKGKNVSDSRKQFEDRPNYRGFDKGRCYNEGGFEDQGDCQSSKCPIFADSWKKETCSRRLFEKEDRFSAFKNVESREFECHANKKTSTFGFPFSTNRSSKRKSIEAKCGIQYSSNGDWRRRLWDNDADTKQAMKESEFSARPSSSGDWRRRDSEKKQAMVAHANSPTSTTFPGSIPTHRVGSVSQAALNSQDLGQRSEIPVSNSMSECTGGKDAAQEVQSSVDSTTGNSALKYQGFTAYSGKSWADMVEEEEELLRECMDNFISEGEYPSQESPSPFQTPSKSVDRWTDVEFTHNENMDSNIMDSTPLPPTPRTYCPPPMVLTTQPRRVDYTHNLQRKLELIDLKEKSRPNSGDGSSWRNSTARKALSFEKTDSADFYRPSPLRKKALFSTEDDSSAASMRWGSTRSDLKPQERRGNKRLQVFQEITP